MRPAKRSPRAGNNRYSDCSTDGDRMVLEPIHALEYSIAADERGFNWRRMLSEGTTLLVDLRPQRTMTRSQFQQLWIHCVLSRLRRNCAISASSSAKLDRNILLGCAACCFSEPIR